MSLMTSIAIIVCTLIVCTLLSTPSLFVHARLDITPGKDVLIVQKGWVTAVIGTTNAVRLQASFGLDAVPAAELQLDSMFQCRKLDGFANEDSVIEGSRVPAYIDKYTIAEPEEVEKDTYKIAVSTGENVKPGYRFVFHMKDDGTAELPFDVEIKDVEDDFWKAGAQYLALCWRMKWKGTETDGFVDLVPVEPPTADDGGYTVVTYGNGTSFRMPNEAKRGEEGKAEAHVKVQDKLLCALYGKFTGKIEHSAIMTTPGSSATRLMSSSSATSLIASMVMMTIFVLMTLF